MNIERQRRRSIRLKGYDYSSAGAYFITLCTYDRRCLFGEIETGAMHLNKTGQVISDEWLRTATVRPTVTVDHFVVMPNHIHGIIVLTDTVGANRRLAPTIPPLAPTARSGATTPPPAGSIGAIMAQFKSVTTKRINALLGTKGAPLWQRNYYEHVIRQDSELNEIRRYILDNPLRWEMDQDNPASSSRRARQWS